jgi:acyl carrier protein phosphodiesterase
MNYLGHLFFSNNDLELMYANIYGDFIKGSKLSHHPKIIQKGVKLHRSIDSYIDNHPKVLNLKKTLTKDLPKISGIAIDLYFDHILAKHWETYSSETLKKFTETFHAHDFDVEKFDNQHFLFLLDKMKSDKWLTNYQFNHGLEFACRGLSKRISFSNQLYTAPEIFTTFRTEIEQTFNDFMTDAVPYFKQYHHHLKS